MWFDIENRGRHLTTRSSRRQNAGAQFNTSRIRSVSETMNHQSTTPGGPREHLARLSSTVRRQIGLSLMMRIRFTLTIVLSTSLISCTTFKTLSPDKSLISNSQSIKVYLIDGRIIKFLAGEYKVDPSSDAGYIQGSGVQSVVGENQEGRFTGDISRQAINGIQVSEPTGLTTTTGYITLGILSLGLLYFVLILTSGSSH